MGFNGRNREGLTTFRWLHILCKHSDKTSEALAPHFDALIKGNLHLYETQSSLQLAALPVYKLSLAQLRRRTSPASPSNFRHLQPDGYAEMFSFWGLGNVKQQQSALRTQCEA